MNPRHSPRPMPKAVFVSTVCGKAKTAELFCKERLWVYNYVMKTTKIIQKDYSLSSMNYQSKLPFELEVLIPDDDPVRLLSAFVEELEPSVFDKNRKVKSTTKIILMAWLWGINNQKNEKSVSLRCGLWASSKCGQAFWTQWGRADERYRFLVFRLSHITRGVITCWILFSLSQINNQENYM